MIYLLLENAGTKEIKQPIQAMLDYMLVLD